MASVLIAGAAASAAVMACAWLLSVRWRDASIADVAWGLAFAAVAVVTAAVGDGTTGRRALLVVLVSVWGLRLAIHLGIRTYRRGEEDVRYKALRRRQGPSFWWVSLITVFGLQGALVWVVALPVQTAMVESADLGWLDLVGTLVWGVGFLFEAVGDEQLRRFRADPDRGEVMDRGLWRWTRHPNYFGDALMWWGLLLIALSSGAGWWVAIGPAVMTFLLLKVSGKPLLERRLARRPGYDDYISRTSGFVPLPPRGPRS